MFFMVPDCCNAVLFMHFSLYIFLVSIQGKYCMFYPIGHLIIHLGILSS